jgi:hypothetical protein
MPQNQTSSRCSGVKKSTNDPEDKASSSNEPIDRGWMKMEKGSMKNEERKMKDMESWNLNILIIY